MRNPKMNCCLMRICSYHSASSACPSRSPQVQTAEKHRGLGWFLWFVFSSPLAVRWGRLVFLLDIGWVWCAWRIQLFGLILGPEGLVWRLVVAWRCLCIRNRRWGRKHGRGLRPWSCQGIGTRSRSAQYAVRSVWVSGFRCGYLLGWRHLECCAGQMIT